MFWKRKCKRKGVTEITPIDFIIKVEELRGRKLDSESKLFFLAHPTTVSLCDQILFNGLVCDPSIDEDPVILALVLEVAEYTPTLGDVELDPKNPYLQLVEEFSKSCSDAGAIVARVFVKYLRMDAD